MPDAPAVPALIPLSLLEAIRNLDTPVEDGLADYAEDIVSRRLGLSTTVAAQIQRYKETADRDGTVPADEVISVLRLVGRRPDAGLAFADAGRRAARYAARARGRSAQAFFRVSPGAVGRRMASRAVRKVAAAVFRGELAAHTPDTEVRMRAPLSILAMPDGSACGFYGAVYGELLRYMTGFEGAVVHERCEARGDDGCLWRAEAGEMFD